MKAAIDIGSNTVQLLAGTVCDGQIKPQLQLLQTTRLGFSPFPNLLDPKRIGDTLSVLTDYQRQLDSIGVHDVSLIATSAVRDAQNRDLLIDSVRDKLGWQIRVLNGRDEAIYSYRGVSLLRQKGVPILVLDIGGGSTELIWSDEPKQIKAQSINVGAVRVHLKGWSEGKIEDIVEQQLKKARLPIPASKKMQVIGVGGTVTTAAAVLKNLQIYSRDEVHGTKLDDKNILDLRNKLAALSVADRYAYSPLLKQRGDIIVDGLTILIVIMRALGISELIASGAGILDGVLLTAYAQV